MKELVSRNKPIINEMLQNKISRCKLAFVGCGLGSNIAILAARVGFRRFALADGDVVELSNLNRQYFSLKDIKKNKAKVLKKRILSIQPTAKVDAIDKFLDGYQYIFKFIRKTDVIINTADFNNGFYETIAATIRAKKLTLAPFNIGFGSAVTAFGKQNEKATKSFSKKESLITSDKDHFIQLLKIAKKHYQLPDYFLKVFRSIPQRKGTLTKWPQIGIASEITSALVVTLIIKHLEGKKIPFFPRVASVDLFKK